MCKIKNSINYFILFSLILFISTSNMLCDIEFSKLKKNIKDISINVDTIDEISMKINAVNVYSSMLNKTGLPNVNNIYDNILKISKKNKSPLSSLLPNVTKNCYTFSGWFNDSLNLSPIDLTKTAAEVENIYAGWTKNSLPVSASKKFTVTYMNEGAIYHKGTLDSCSSTRLASIIPENPLTNNPGYKFIGWYLDNKKTTLFNHDYPLTVDVNLYSNFEKIFIVNFIINGKIINELQKKIREGEKVTKPISNPELNGYTFDNWYKDISFNIKYEFTSPITENTNIYANFIPNVYSVTFHNNGGDGVYPTNTRTNNLKISPPTILPTKNGFIFTGWNLLVVGVNLNFDFDINKIYKDEILYAQWVTKNTNFNVTFNKGNGITQNMVILYNEKIHNLPEDGIPDFGYHFIGWNTEPNGNGVDFDIVNTPITSNLILYPKFLPIPYTIVYSTNNGDLSVNQITKTINYDNIITSPNTLPTKAGSYILTWNTKADGTGNEVILDLTPLNNSLFDFSTSSKQFTIYPIWSK